MLKDPSQQAALVEALALAKQLAVGYAGLILTLDMFPQPPEAQVGAAGWGSRVGQVGMAPDGGCDRVGAAGWVRQGGSSRWVPLAASGAGGGGRVWTC